MYMYLSICMYKCIYITYRNVHTFIAYVHMCLYVGAVCTCVCLLIVLQTKVSNLIGLKIGHISLFSLLQQKYFKNVPD